MDEGAEKQVFIKNKKVNQVNCGVYLVLAYIVILVFKLFNPSVNLGFSSWFWAVVPLTFLPGLFAQEQ